MIQELPLTHIFPSPVARKVDEANVRGLIDSIAEIGLINPLRVRPARRMVDGIEADAYEVTAGGHRLKALQRLGFETVPCNVVSDDDLHAELAMIDENLMRAQLGEAEKTAQTIRRKAIYEELHPETRHGGDRRSDQVANIGDLNSVRFTKETAAAIGKSERVVQRIAERGDKIIGDALRLVSNTKLDTGAFLDKLKTVAPENQINYVNKHLADLSRKELAEKDEREAQREKNRERVRTKRECDEANAVRVIEHLPHEALEAFVADLFGAGHRTLAEEIKMRLGVSIMDRNYSEVA